MADEFNNQTASAEKAQAHGESRTASVSIEVDFSSWFETLKGDAKEIMSIWERGSDIPPKKSKIVISFFILIHSYIEAESERLCKKELSNSSKSIDRELKEVIKKERGWEKIQDSLRDINVRQHEREKALSNAEIIGNAVQEQMEETRWIRNKIAHNREAAIKKQKIEGKFEKNGKEFNAKKAPGRALNAFKSLKRIDKES